MRGAVRMEVSAKELAKLIGVTERSIHRAEKAGKLGSKVKLGMELLQSRMAHGEIDIPSALGAAPRRGRPPKRGDSSWSANRLAITVRIGMENFGLALIYAVGVNKPVCIKRTCQAP